MPGKINAKAVDITVANKPVVKLMMMARWIPGKSKNVTKGSRLNSCPPKGGKYPKAGKIAPTTPRITGKTITTMAKMVIMVVSFEVNNRATKPMEMCLKGSGNALPIRFR